VGFIHKPGLITIQHYAGSEFSPSGGKGPNEKKDREYKELFLLLLLAQLLFLSCERGFLGFRIKTDWRGAAGRVFIP